MEPAFPGVPNPPRDRIPVRRTKTGTSSPEKTLFFNNKYMTTAKMHSTPTYDLYLGVDVATKQQIALKLEKTSVQIQIIFNEARALNSLRGKEDEGVRGVPKLYWSGTEEDFNVTAQELTGPNLKFLQKTRNRGFSLKTILMLADQMLKRIEYVHTKGFLHRDIKPTNFAIGLLEQSNTVYLINFEYSKQYKSTKNNQHKPYAENKEMVGSATFSSINCHLGIEPSRRDDLESLGYTLVYLHKGFLPWEATEGSSTREKIAKIMDKKIAIPPEALCKGMPDAFSAYFNYCKGLRYDEKPDYKFIRELFRKVMVEREISYDNCFDWVTSQQTSTENLVYEFGDLSISFKTNPQTDFTRSNISQVLNKSKLSYSSKIEYDAFSQEEQQTSNIVPIDLSIASDNNERSFPSKTVLMPSSMSSITRGLRPPETRGGSKRSLTSMDDRGVDLREDLLSKDLVGTNRNIKTNDILSSEDDDLKYKHLGTASTMNKTVSMKVPDTENYKSRSTTYNIVFEDDENLNKMEADIDEHEPLSGQITRALIPGIKTFEKNFSFEPKEGNISREEVKRDKETFRQKKTETKSDNEDIEEHKLTPRKKDKKTEQNECALF